MILVSKYRKWWCYFINQNNRVCDSSLFCFGVKVLKLMAFFSSVWKIKLPEDLVFVVCTKLIENNKSFLNHFRLFWMTLRKLKWLALVFYSCLMWRARMAGFIPTSCRCLHRMRKYQLYTLNWKYLKVVKRYISYCRLIGSLHFTFSHQILGILSMLMQW